MENSIEEAIERLEYIDRAYSYNNYYSVWDLKCIEILLSDYKRVLKENEILKEEKEQAWEEWNNLEQGSYGTEQKLKQQIKELRKENEELKDFKKQVTDIESTNFIKYKNYIPIQKIKAKIEELDIAISECIYLDEDDKAYKKAVKKDKLCLLNQKRTLQELLEGGQS